MPKEPITTIPSSPTPRQLLEQAVACLIEYLDSADPDPDLEEGGDDEPSLGWATSVWCPQNPSNGYGAGDDREQQCEDEGAEEGV